MTIPGPRLADLAAQGWLSTPPAAGADHSVPGSPLVARALGLLHANCGSCHSEDGIARPDTNLILRLSVVRAFIEELPAP